MRLNLNKRTAAVAAAGLGIPALAAAANFAEIASLFSNLDTQAILASLPFEYDPKNLSRAGLFLSGTVLGGVSAYAVTARLSQRRATDLAKIKHDFLDQLRTDTEHLRSRMARGDMTREELCRHFKQTMYAAATNLDRIATLVEGRPCHVGIYVLRETGQIQSEHRSFASNRERFNFQLDQRRLSTGMKKVREKNELDSPIHIAENISSNTSKWEDPSSDHHAQFYRSCATIGIQYRPQHDYDEGTFYPSGSCRRVLAGFLQVESTGRRFRSKEVIETMAGMSDTLFSAIANFSQAEGQITGDYGSALHWILRAMTNRRDPGTQDD